MINALLYSRRSIVDQELTSFRCLPDRSFRLVPSLAVHDSLSLHGIDQHGYGCYISSVLQPLRLLRYVHAR